MQHEPNATLRCSYLSIPQVQQTHEILICKPSWIWGAEMGVNDARVAIGNEAVFTKAKRGKPSLTGMDLLRLALERSDTAAAAVTVIIDLLEAYGQGGNCGFDKECYYDNSFLVCDPSEGYVLETSGKDYAVIEIEDRYAISNGLSIGSNHSKRAGLAADEDFARRFTEPVRTFFSRSSMRRRQVMERLQPSSSAKSLVETLRTHASGLSGQEFLRASVGSVCMHAGGLIGDHTTGSLVVALRQDKPVTLWLTGCSTPCISAFKPVFWHSDAPPLFKNPSPSLAYWLRREHVHRAVLAGRIEASVLRARIKEAEARWFAEEDQIMRAKSPDEAALAALAADASREEQCLIDELYDENWRDFAGTGRYSRYWRQKNEKLGK
jgi:dipeptidase